MKQWEKLAYFRYFFCGREDVYAFRVPEGGYRPRRRPRFDLSDSMIARHMVGKVLLGAYPLLPNGNTHWVAADFDGKNNNAFEEARILSDALRSYDVETLCNTSQSGNGVHVRVIFTEYIPAWLARNLMNAFIEAEGLKREKDGGAFDRLFPTQDELDLRDPNAIGNQIAMPLNMVAAAERGGTMLLDNDFEPAPLGDATWDLLEMYERVNRRGIGDALYELGRADLLVTGTEREQRQKSGNRAPAPTGDYSTRRRGTRTAADLMFMLGKCDFMRYAQQGNLDYWSWIVLAANLAQFDGHGGRKFWHSLSAKDERYNADKAARKYDNISTKFTAPITCAKLAREGWRCPRLGRDGQCDKFRDVTGRGPRTPATISFFVDEGKAA